MASSKQLGSISSIIPPIHPEGTKFIILFAIATVLISWIWDGFLPIGVALTIWCALFFRDPVRQVPQGEGILVAPADGVVCDISETELTPEIGLGEGKRTRVCIFMNVFNVHVNRTPAAGTVERIHYIPGLFLNASLDKASTHNERMVTTFKLADGALVPCVQIAGLVARRIVGFVSEGASLKAGERYGLIRFGSRVDVWLPEGYTPQVTVGQVTLAGESIIAAAGVPARSAHEI